MPPPSLPIFSAAEIEKMRLYVGEHDKQASMNSFDLNNPPRVNYTHQAYPKVVYGLTAEGKPLHKRVEDAQEHAAALAAGFSNEPQAEPEVDDVELDAAAQAEVKAIEDRVAAARKKAGKNAKAKAN